MRRKKSRAKRRVPKSAGRDGGDAVPAVEAEMNNPQPSENVPEASKAGNEGEKDIDREFDCFKEGFEEVETVISAVMEMDVITTTTAASSSVELNKLNFEINEKPDNLNVSFKCTKIEEGSVRVRAKNLDSNTEIIENEIEYRECEEANVDANAEEELAVGEPSASRIEVMKLDMEDGNKEEDEDGGEKQQESRNETEQNKEFELGEANEVPPQFNQGSLTEWKKEKPLELHVGHLHKDAVEQDLFEIFGKFGEVGSARIMRHPTTNKSRGFAFIQYATVEQAKKVLSVLKDGIEVKGKRAKISVSHDRNMLHLQNICKTWTKADVLQKLKGLGIKDIDEIQVPTDPKKKGKIKGFAILRFGTCSDAKAALHSLRKPDAIFGNAKGAKVAFACSRIHSRKEVQLQVKTIYVQGIPKSWNVQKLRAICEQYGEVKRVKIFWNFCDKGKDFGSISFTTRTSAVACVEGMNKAQFGEGIKVKACIARPLVGGRLQKSTCRRLKLNKRLRSTGGWNMKSHAKSEGTKKESDMKARTVINKSKTKRTEQKATAIVHKNNQDPSNLKCNIEGETNKESMTPEAHGAGLSAKSKITGSKRKNRKRRRNRMESKRLLRKVEGSSQSRPSHFSGISKGGSPLRKGPNRGAHSLAHRIPHEEAYAEPTRGRSGYAYDAISGSKRPSSELELHAGVMQPVRYQDQYHAGCVTPAFQNQGKTCAGYLKLDTQYDREPPAKYFKPALGNDALPHAGFLEPAFAKQSFDGNGYSARRTCEYDSPGDRGPIYRAGSASYVTNSIGYAGFEVRGVVSGYRRGGAAYPPAQTRY